VVDICTEIALVLSWKLTAP